MLPLHAIVNDNHSMQVYDWAPIDYEEFRASMTQISRVQHIWTNCLSSPSSEEGTHFQCRRIHPFLLSPSSEVTAYAVGTVLGALGTYFSFQAAGEPFAMAVHGGVTLGLLLGCCCMRRFLTHARSPQIQTV